MHEGVRPNGARLYPAFPYTYFTRMSRGDSDAIHAYLNTLEPVRNAVDRNTLPFPFNIRASMLAWNALFLELGEFRPDPNRSPEWNRGAYIVEGPAHCGACHTPRNRLGGDRTSERFAGGALQGWFAASITDDQRLGLGSWSTDEIVGYLRTGRNARSAASGPMAEVVMYSTALMTDADLRAIATYLKEPPVQPATMPPSAGVSATSRWPPSPPISAMPGETPRRPSRRMTRAGCATCCATAPEGGARQRRPAAGVEPVMLSRRVLLAAAGLVAGCSPLDLANSLTPSGGIRLEAGLPYGPGERGRYDLYTPPGAGPDTPLLVFFYGGGWRSGARGDYGFAARALASLGLVVAVPDYRLFPEVGWPGFVEDGAAAMTAIGAGAGRGRRVFVMGHSAGAFIALALAADPRWLGERRAGLAGAIGLAGPYEFGPEEDPAGIFAGAPGRRARVAPSSAAALRGTPPLLLLHGEADDTVRPAQTLDFATLAAAQDVAVTARLYPGVGHVGILAALAGPVRALGLEGAPVLTDVGAWLGVNRARIPVQGQEISRSPDARQAAPRLSGG
jgi:acetyl esterase/lipase/mono/diheme cytochrome c family protein